MKSYFADSGVHAVVDGQYGSTGKGALSAYLAHLAVDQGVRFDAVLSNAGPNSGHTFYDKQDYKHVLKQLPVFAVASYLEGVDIPVYLTAGSIINPRILFDEMARYPNLVVYVHPNAAVIRDEDVEAEHSGTIAAVAGTRSGTGAAIARKVLRDPDAVMSGYKGALPGNLTEGPIAVRWRNRRYFMEISQGFSLGINQRFYPKCTSRECTVSQGLSDASLPPAAISRTFMSMRTYPIRVGNVDGHSSGDCYYDQREISWDSIGQPPELTTVTQRERRLFTFSDNQFHDAIAANDPDFVFMNFMNYLPDTERGEFLTKLHRTQLLYKDRFNYISGYGPKSENIGDGLF